MPKQVSNFTSSVTNLPVATMDDSGNEAINGNLSVGGSVYLSAQSTAPVQQPGQLAMYSPDGKSVSYVGAGGQAVAQTVNGNLTVTGTASVTGTTSLSSVQMTRGAASTAAIDTFVTGDTMARYNVNADGGTSWGGGTLATDTNLYRGTTNQLQTDSKFQVGGLAILNGGTTTAGSAPVLTPTFANGTASQLTDTTRDYMVYLVIGTVGVAFTLQIGPTAGVASTIMPSATPLGDELLTVRLPAGWFLKWAGTGTTLSNQIAIGC